MFPNQKALAANFLRTADVPPSGKTLMGRRHVKELEAQGMKAIELTPEMVGSVVYGKPISSYGDERSKSMKHYDPKYVPVYNDTMTAVSLAIAAQSLPEMYRDYTKGMTLEETQAKIMADIYTACAMRGSKSRVFGELLVASVMRLGESSKPAHFGFKLSDAHGGMGEVCIPSPGKLFGLKPYQQKMVYDTEIGQPIPIHH